MTDKLEIINKAVDVLRGKHPKQDIEVTFDDKYPHLKVMGKDFVCLTVPEMTMTDVLEPLPNELRGKDAKPVIYITVNAHPKVLDFATNTGVNVLDCAGNYNIQYLNKNGVLFFTWANKGEKPVDVIKEKAYPIFKEAGIKVIFYLLCDRQNINKPYREIQDATGVAIGTVKNIIDGMVYHQFAKIEGRKRFLINIDRLLMLWTANYGQTLKPKLFLTRMAFRDKALQNEWQRITLPAGMMWGGEAAAAKTDGYLEPGKYTIYTDVPAPMLIKTGAVVPAADGNIAVYKTFWKVDTIQETVPPILTYADLMETGNGRCIEEAKKMKENELKYLF